MKINRKLLLFVLPLFVLALVSSVAVYYAFFSVTFTVNQPIDITGDLTQELLGVVQAGETVIGEAVTISNDGDTARTVKIVETSGSSDVEVSYVGKLDLTKKNTETWELIGEPVELTYTVVGSDFEFSGVPEGYALVYYKDAVVGLEGRLDNPQPVIEIVGSIGSMPQSDDANLNADYSQAPDEYDHKIGAKLWAVPTSAILEGNVLDWTQMNDFYYETDLAYYFANADNEITVPAGSFITFYPAFTPSVYAEGSYTFEFEIQ